MRYGKAHKNQVRDRIIDEAAAALRRAGLAGVGIPVLMKRAGLTHGAFYVHFKNRSELVAAAVSRASEQTAMRVFGDALPLEAALAQYLSADHVAHPEVGCVVAALGADGARADPPVKAAFAHAARGLIRLVDGKLKRANRRKAPCDRALDITAHMVGAVVLARLVDDPALAGRLLGRARAQA